MSVVKEEAFKTILDRAVKQLREDIWQNESYRAPSAFEDRVREVLSNLTKDISIRVKDNTHPHVFPDIVVNGFGIEVKSTKQDSWRSTANSIMETMREKGVQRLYVIFGKMGGKPDVRWRDYAESIYHVRISHAPRFCVEMEGEEESLFKKIGIPYEAFAVETPEVKMERVRQYARSRLKKGERLWWLENQNHSLPLAVRRFSDLDATSKIQMRAEAAVLCPEIVAPSRTRGKYDAVAHYLITYRGVLWSRDMFSAGSVGMTSGERGGKHVQRQFADIEEAMMKAFAELEDALFHEYWGIDHVPESVRARLTMWLLLADGKARGKWMPSKEIFQWVLRN